MDRAAPSALSAGARERERDWGFIGVVAQIVLALHGDLQRQRRHTLMELALCYVYLFGRCSCVETRRVESTFAVGPGVICCTWGMVW